MDNPWGYYAKWNKPVTKVEILWFHLYAVCRRNLETQNRMPLSGDEGRGEWGVFLGL